MSRSRYRPKSRAQSPLFTTHRPVFLHDHYSDYDGHSSVRTDNDSSEEQSGIIIDRKKSIRVKAKIQESSEKPRLISNMYAHDKTRGKFIIKPDLIPMAETPREQQDPTKVFNYEEIVFDSEAQALEKIPIKKLEAMRDLNEIRRKRDEPIGKPKNRVTIVQDAPGIPKRSLKTMMYFNKKYRRVQKKKRVVIAEPSKVKHLNDSRDTNNAPQVNIQAFD